MLQLPATAPAAATWPDGREHGSCATHSRYLWGSRLYVVANLGELPAGSAFGRGPFGQVANRQIEHFQNGLLAGSWPQSRVTRVTFRSRAFTDSIGSGA